MTFLFTPRMGDSGADPVVPPTLGGYYPFPAEVYEKSGKVGKKEYFRVKALRKRLKYLKTGEVSPEDLEFSTLPESINKQLSSYEPETRTRLENGFKSLVLAKLDNILNSLQTVQLEREELEQLWQQAEDEEVVLFMMMF